MNPLVKSVIDNYHPNEDEFQRYLKEVVINIKRDDPMEWWRKFPHGAKMARKYLAIPASTAPSEGVSAQQKIYSR